MMKLWIGGELDSSIADSFRISRNNVERKINKQLELHCYGSAVINWDVILIVSTTPSPKLLKFLIKEKVTDIRVILDYDTFATATLNEQEKLIFEALINSLSSVIEKYKIVDLDLMALSRDLRIVMNL